MCVPGLALPVTIVASGQDAWRPCLTRRWWGQCVYNYKARVCTKYQVSTDQLPYKALVVCVPIKYQLTAPEIAPVDTDVDVEFD